MAQRIGSDTAIGEGEFTVIEARETESDAKERSLEDWLEETDEAAGLTVRVYRDATQRYGKETFLFAFQVEDYTMTQLLERVRDEYGEGKYRAKAYREKPHRLVFNKDFAVEVSKRDQAIKQPQAEISPLGEIVPVMQEMLLMLRDLREKPVQAAQPVQTIDTGAIMMQSLKMFAELQSAFAPQRSAGGGDSFETLAKAFTLFNEMKTGLGGEGEPNDSAVIIEALRQLGPILQKSTEGQQAKKPIQQQQPAKRLQPPAATSTSQPIAQQKTQEQMEHEAMMAAMENHLAFLLTQAARGADPALYADVVLDQVPEQMLQKFAEFVYSPSCYDQLVFLNQEVPKYADWFRAIINSLREGLTQEEEGADTSLSEEGHID